jgi:DNA invertase Pin-like site-specific DNA recombinase
MTRNDQASQARAVIYARYSSDNQRAASIEDQVRICRDFIDAKGWSLASVYTDAAISGATVLRPGYQKLLEDARRQTFEFVAAEALDRLSRDQEDVAGLYKQLSFAGVKLVTVAEGEINELHVGLKGTMNALYLKDLADKTRRGLRGKVEAGRSAGGLCFGYTVVRRNGENGNAENGERTVDTSEALIIRRIFREYADGRSPRAIARGLNAEGIPGPAGKAWGASTINGNVRRGTGILNNELYIGRLVWNRLRYVKDPRTGKRVSRPNPDSSLIVRDVPELRIVDQALWDRVKERQGRARRNTRPDMAVRPFWDRRRPRYLFSGLVKCGVCGAATPRSVPICSAAPRRGIKARVTTGSTSAATCSRRACSTASSTT